MEYKVIRLNDNNTATVMLYHDGFELQQDFDLGQSVDEFVDNIKQGLALLKRDTDGKQTDGGVLTAYSDMINVVTAVDDKAIAALDTTVAEDNKAT